VRRAAGTAAELGPYYREEGSEMSEDTIFGKIARHEIPVDLVYEDDLAVAFRDISPQAPVHVLVIPKKPVTNLADPEATPELLGGLLARCREVAKLLGLEEGGYRVVANVGADGGQTVAHLHFHILGGRAMQWPPG
jgi:histidine triad (HIT) family protein